LEGALPDAIASRIVAETITPHFKLGDYDGGVEAGIDQMVSVVNGEPLPQPDRKWEHRTGLGNLLPLLLVIVFVVSGVLRAPFGRLLGSVATGAVAGGLVWLLSHLLPIGLGAGVLAFLFAMLTGSSSRGWSAGRGWGGGFGGGLGGGFGGGGGVGWGGGGGGASAAAVAVSGAAAPRGAGDANRPLHAPRCGDALAHAHVVSSRNPRCHRTGHRPRRTHPCRGDSLRHRNGARARACVERPGAARSRARGVRSSTGLGHRAQQRRLDLRAAGGPRRGDRGRSRLRRPRQPRGMGGGVPPHGRTLPRRPLRNRFHRRDRCHRQFARAPLPAELKAAGPIS